ncbi:DoxX family membrane protein [Streptomyces sp. NPDC046805]|uniref:DoxX family protein n=1 Tax=Streptomyces sp. NPDC046805 TaxID=3155134 RepID=UPI0033EF1C0D
MDIGLLLLRLLLSGLLFGHGAQKMFGWYGGFGPKGTATVFEPWGFRPGKPLVVLAAFCEMTAAALMALGLLSALGAAMGLGTMAVAASVNVSKGIWAQAGGYELALVYGVLAAALGFTGPGQWSLDHVLGLEGLTGARPGGAAVALGLVTALCLIGYAARNRRRRPA